MSLHLNIVAFDVPYPPNYGGVIDVFYKIRWLHASGVKVHLHCFAYGRARSKELEALCEETFYYKRKTGLTANLSLLPYTVESRRSSELKKNLLRNQHPILFEVLHTCYLLKDFDFAGRKRVFRHSNIEHEYYFEIARSEKRFLRKLFHYVEAYRLKRFEKVLRQADLILAVNENDTGYFADKFPRVRSLYLPSFHANSEVRVAEGRGDYLLVHGNLGVSENYEAVLWLLKNVLHNTNHRTIVAGLRPPGFLTREISKHANVTLIGNPSQEQMAALIRDAQVHLLYTSQPTGLKLKLLNVLFGGRFIVCNSNMVSGTGLMPDDTLKIVDSAEAYQRAIDEQMHCTFDGQMLQARKVCVSRFDNLRNVQKLVAEVFRQ